MEQITEFLTSDMTVMQSFVGFFAALALGFTVFAAMAYCIKKRYYSDSDGD